LNTADRVEAESADGGSGGQPNLTPLQGQVNATQTEPELIDLKRMSDELFDRRK